MSWHLKIVQNLEVSALVQPTTHIPTPSTSSAMKTPNSYVPDPSSSLVQTEEMPENREGDSDVPEQTAEGDI
jgi:hypothetical protein